jgi:WD40 repeat protein
MISFWKIKSYRNVKPELLATLRGHSDKVLCLSASRSYSILVSGSEDGTAIIWDINRKLYIKSLFGHNGPVFLTAINEKTVIINCFS